MDPTIVIAVGKELYKATKAKHSTDYLSREALQVLLKFKSSYDCKDIKGLSSCFAKQCEVEFYGAESKAELIEAIRNLFEQLFAFVTPHFTMTLHRIDENTEKGYQAVISFNAKCKVFGIEVPFTDYATGNAICRIEPSSNGGSQWQITRLTHEDD